MAIALKSKPGLTTANTLDIPKDWDAKWFRNLISNKLQGADVRNAIPGPGISITGNISTPYATISIGGSGPVTLPGPVTITGGGLIIGAPTGGNEGVGTVNATGFFLNGVNQFQSGTFTGTITGCTATITGTMRWVMSGNIVTLYAPIAMIGTSNTTAMTMTGLPAAIQPNVRQIIAMMLEDNSGNVSGYADMQASGTITFARQVVATGNFLTTGFTASAAKGLNGSQWTYSLT